MAACIDLVRREISDLSEKELDEVLEQMRARQARLIQDGADPGTASAQAGREIADSLRAAAAIEKRNAAINLRIRTEALDYIRTTWNDDPVEGVLALIYGSPKARFGSRASVNAAQDAQFRRLAGGAAGELEAAGLFDVLRRGEMDRDVARAMWHIDNPTELRKLPEQAQQIAQILRKWQDVARIEANRHGAWIGKDPNYIVRQSHHPDRLATAGFERWKEDILPQLDLARMFPDGPPKDMDDWLHEAYLNLSTGVRIKDDVSGAKMSAFKGPGNLAKKLSQERVFHFRSPDAWFDYNEKYGFGNLREAYIQGLHRSAENTGLMQVLGTNPEYNLDAIVTSVRASLSRSNPELLKKFDAARQRIERGYKEVSGYTRQVASQRLATIGAGLRAFNTLTGLGGAVISSVTDVPVRASALRHQGQSYLGELGKGLIAPIRRIVGGVGSTERKATLSALGYFNEIAMGNLAARFSPDENLPGRIQRATHTFFKWNLLGGWTDEMRRSSLESMGRFFGGLADTDFVRLSDRTRRTLERFRIGEAEWNVLHKGLVAESGGEKFLTPQAVRELPPEDFAPLARERIRAIKESVAVSANVPPAKPGMVRMYHGGSPEGVTGQLWFTSSKADAEGWASRGKEMRVWYVDVPESTLGGDIANGIAPLSRVELPAAQASKRKVLEAGVSNDIGAVDRQITRILEDTRESMASRLQQLYADEVNSAAISPDARTLATLRQGTQAGTPMGEALRLFWQFKSFGIAMMQRGFLREFYGYGRGAGGKLGMSEIRGLALFMAGSIGFGYMAMAMKDLLRGKEPKPLDSPKTWASAAAQGGGFGIYGDFLFGEANRFGGGFMQTLGGPTVGKAEELYQLWGSLKRGDDAGAQALKLAYRNTPFLNLFYLRAAADYLVLYELQEAMNPGYLRRMERRQEEETGQEWWLRPSEVVN